MIASLRMSMGRKWCINLEAEYKNVNSLSLKHAAMVFFTSIVTYGSLLNQITFLKNYKPFKPFAHITSSLNYGNKSIKYFGWWIEIIDKQIIIRDRHSLQLGCFSFL